MMPSWWPAARARRRARPEERDKHRCTNGVMWRMARCTSGDSAVHGAFLHSFAVSRRSHHASMRTWARCPRGRACGRQAARTAMGGEGWRVGGGGVACLGAPTCIVMMSRSSSDDQSPFFTRGSRWLCHLSRHCLPDRLPATPRQAHAPTRACRPATVRSIPTTVKNTGRRVARARARARTRGGHVCPCSEPRARTEALGDSRPVRRAMVVDEPPQALVLLKMGTAVRVPRSG